MLAVKLTMYCFAWFVMVGGALAIALLLYDEVTTSDWYLLRQEKKEKRRKWKAATDFISKIPVRKSR